MPVRNTGDVAPGGARDDWALEDTGIERRLRVNGREYATRYSARLVHMLVERKGPQRAASYFTYKETRGRVFLDPLFCYLAGRGASALRVLEVGCSFGHITEYLHEQPAVAEVHTFDVDSRFVEITRAKVAELALDKVRAVRCLTDEETTRLPYADGAFDLVIALAVVEHLPAPSRHRYVDEYYRLLKPGGHIAILDTPNRGFPLETHSVGLPGIQWLPDRLAYGYARALRPSRVATTDFPAFREGAWRNAWFRDCLPSTGRRELIDVTETAGYGYGFFRRTARSRLRRAVLPLFGFACWALAITGRPRSLALPYFNLVFQKAERASA